MLLLGRYQLIREIGRGGMAEVWEARALGDRGFARRVAVKRLTADGPAMERMFVDEAQIASRLHHANVLAVLDFGVADGVPFQVLEYVDGLDADALQALARARGSGIPAACALHVTAEVARGLDHAHRARGDDGELLGIVHRDVSPNNILVAWSGEVKLGDFGIAFARDRGGATEAGTTKGKPCYMAPEQLTRGTLDPRTDLFGLGCVLHALVAGESPMAGEDRMADLLAGKPLPLAPELPDDVRAIVALATRRSRSERFEDAAGIAAACDEAARARAGGDPRRALVEWLGTLRPEEMGPPAGALDRLFEVTPVLLETPAARAELAPARVEVEAKRPGALGRMYGATPVLPETPGARQERVEVEAQQPGALERMFGATPARRFGTRPRLLVAVTVLLVVAGGGSALVARAREAAPLEPPAAAAFTVLPPAGAAGGEREAGGAGDVRALPSPPPVVVSAAAPVAAPAPKRPPARAISTETGFLQISGEIALRKEILVDGKSAGFAPKTLELPVGAHQIALRGEDGNVIGSRRVEITSWETRSAPARWTPEAPENP